MQKESPHPTLSPATLPKSHAPHVHFSKSITAPPSVAKIYSIKNSNSLERISVMQQKWSTFILDVVINNPTFNSTSVCTTGKLLWPLINLTVIIFTVHHTGRIVVIKDMVWHSPADPDENFYGFNPAISTSVSSTCSICSLCSAAIRPDEYLVYAALQLWLNWVISTCVGGDYELRVGLLHEGRWKGNI